MQAPPLFQSGCPEGRELLVPRVWELVPDSRLLGVDPSGPAPLSPGGWATVWPPLA